MVENCNISKDQWLFLKGHIEAIVAMCDHSSYFKFFHDFSEIHLEHELLCFFDDFDCFRRSLDQTLYSELSI